MFNGFLKVGVCSPEVKVADTIFNGEKIKAEILKAEEALMPYPFMDEVIFRLEEQGQTLGEMLNQEFYYEKENKISPEIKKQYLEKFASRARGAVFKWNLLPEVAKINENSLNKKEKFEKLKSLLVF